MINKTLLSCLIIASACSWVIILPTRAGQTNNTPLDIKQIRHLERQLSEIRERIDTLRQINDPHTQSITKHLARRPPTKFIVMQFTGLFFTDRNQPDDFRVGDRILTVRSINGSKQITGYGVVANLASDRMAFEVLTGSSTHVEDEVYVISREDTSASIINIFQP